MVETHRRSSITGLDRVSIAVTNLEAARKSFETFGFSLAARSRSVGQGTGNYGILMPGVAGDGCCLELLAQIDVREEDVLLSARLADQGEGLVSLSLKTKDAEAAQTDIIGSGELIPAYRLVERDGTTQIASFLLLDLLSARGQRPAMAAVEHRDHGLTFQPRWMTHANGVVAVREIHVRSDSVREDVLASQQFTTSAQNEAEDRKVADLMGGQRVARLTFLSDKAWEAFYGEGDTSTAGLILECKNAIETKSLLIEAGLEPSFVNSFLNGYRIPVSKTHGIWLTFVSV